MNVQRIMTTGRTRVVQVKARLVNSLSLDVVLMASLLLQMLTAQNVPVSLLHVRTPSSAAARMVTLQHKEQTLKGVLYNTVLTQSTAAVLMAYDQPLVVMEKVVKRPAKHQR